MTKYKAAQLNDQIFVEKDSTSMIVVSADVKEACDACSTCNKSAIFLL